MSVNIDNLMASVPIEKSQYVTNTNIDIKNMLI